MKFKHSYFERTTKSGKRFKRPVHVTKERLKRLFIKINM